MGSSSLVDGSPESSSDSEGFSEVPVPAKGSVLLGKYRVEGVVGFGGMGVVIAARHEHLGERVAIKLLLPAYAKVEEVRKRFQREAQAAYRLRSEHVCRVLDAGELEDGTPFIAMEFLKGEDLGVVLRKQGKLSVSDAADLIVQACEALAEAHASDIVHRDLKPANLVLVKRKDGSPIIKVIDFGISKVAANEAASNLTNTFGYLGSPSYSAPEQFTSTREMTPAGDVWSLGIILYQLVTGEHPFVFESDGLAQMAATIMYEPHVPMSKRDPSLDRAFEAVVGRCLEKEVGARYDDAAALAEALAPFTTAQAGDALARIRREHRRKPVAPAAQNESHTAALAAAPLPAPVRAPEGSPGMPAPQVPPGTIPLQAIAPLAHPSAPRLSEPPRFLEPSAYSQPAVGSPASSAYVPSTTRAGVLTVPPRTPSSSSAWLMAGAVGLIAVTSSLVAVTAYKRSRQPTVAASEPLLPSTVMPTPVPVSTETASAVSATPSATPSASASAASAASSGRSSGASSASTIRVRPRPTGSPPPDPGVKISKDRDGKL